MEVQTINPPEYMKKIMQIEIMLNEIKQGLSFLDKDFQESIEKGEQDIKEGKVVICKTEEELNNFFELI